MKISRSQPDNAVRETAPISAQMAILKTDVAPKAADLRILLVEDDEADLYLIRRALAANPRVERILIARDGDEALEALSAANKLPDLAIVDLRMPRKDGFTLLRDFAARYPAKFPAIVFSSSRAGADVYRAKKRGAVEFITKPNNADKLKISIDQIIDLTCAMVA